MFLFFFLLFLCYVLSLASVSANFHFIWLKKYVSGGTRGNGNIASCIPMIRRPQWSTATAATTNHRARGKTMLPCPQVLRFHISRAKSTDFFKQSCHQKSSSLFHTFSHFPAFHISHFLFIYLFDSLLFFRFRSTLPVCYHQKLYSGFHTFFYFPSSPFSLFFIFIFHRCFRTLPIWLRENITSFFFASSRFL